MNCDELFKRIVERKELADVPILILAKISVVTFEEFEKLAKEAYHVEELQP